jgi:hypothetical protein
MQIIVRRCKSAINCAKITVGVLRQPVLREYHYPICARHNELQHYKIRRFARYRSMSFFDTRAIISSAFDRNSLSNGDAFALW